MSWVRLEDDFFRNPQNMRAGRDGRILQIAAICYCSDQLTDGFVPAEALTIIAAECGVARPHAVAAHLTTPGVELWERVEGGYQIKTYLKYQESAEAVRIKTEAAKERMRRARSQNVRANNQRTSREVPANNQRSSQDVPEMFVQLPTPTPIHKEPVADTPPSNGGSHNRQPAVKQPPSRPKDDLLSIGDVLGSLDLKAERLTLEDRAVALEDDPVKMRRYWSRQIRALEKTPGGISALADRLDEIRNRADVRLCESKGYSGPIQNPAAWLNAEVKKLLKEAQC